MYSNVSLFIDGTWGPAASGRTIDVVNPATGEKIGTVAHAAISDLDHALEAADKGFQDLAQGVRLRPLQGDAQGRRPPARARRRDRPLMTMEQGKPLAEAKGEMMAGADVIDWFAEEAPPRLWPRHPGARRGRLPAGDQGAGRPGRRVHAVELPDQPGGAQAVGRRWPPAARSSSRRRRKRRPRPPN